MILCIFLGSADDIVSSFSGVSESESRITHSRPFMSLVPQKSRLYVGIRLL